MCGIICIFGKFTTLPKYLAHRGPDEQRTITMGKCTMMFSRLAINDTSESGMQPFLKNNSMLVCNGEIYNYKEFAVNTTSTSDCECLIPMIQDFGIFYTAKTILGEFAMCYSDGTEVYAARDPFGVRPLFYTRYSAGNIAFASEAKGLFEFGTRVEIFPPGHVYDSITDKFSCYYSCYWGGAPTLKAIQIKPAFIKAVKIRIENTDRPIGFLLSGGLDSSLVAAVARDLLAPGTRIRTFSIGTPESPDIRAARVMAKFLNSEHTEVNFDIEEGIRVLPEVIKSLESYDTTTVRASVPMWLLCRWISQNTDCRVIISGEGSDELFGGYLYFHYAPDVQHFYLENIRRLRLIHQFDGLRADRCIATHGLELRVPFLDKEFAEVGMTIDQGLKLIKGDWNMEKWILREAFEGTLPNEILWRQKNGMSDAVGYSWITEVKKYAEEAVTDSDFAKIVSETKNHNPPLSKEEALYRRMFWATMGLSNDHLISEIWRPRWTSETDPSAAKLEIHQDNLKADI